MVMLWVSVIRLVISFHYHFCMVNIALEIFIALYVYMI